MVATIFNDPSAYTTLTAANGSVRHGNRKTNVLEDARDKAFALSCTLGARMKNISGLTIIFGILVFEALVVIALTAFIVQSHTSGISSCIISSMTAMGVVLTNLLYCGLVICGQIYQVILCVDMVLQRNVVYLFGLMAYGFLLVIFSGIQVQQTNSQRLWLQELACRELGSDSGPALEYASLSVTIACFLLVAGYSVWLCRDFRFDACIQQQQQQRPQPEKNRKFYIMASVLKLDLFHILLYAAQLVPSGFLQYDATPFESIIVFAITVFVFLLAWYALAKENLPIVGTLVAICGLSIGYFGFRLVTLFLPHVDQPDPYRMTRYSLVYSLVSILVLVVLTIIAGIVYIRHLVTKKKVAQKVTVQ